MKNQKNNPYTDAIYLAIGELIVSIVTILVYIALNYFDWTVITGTILGSIVTITNFLILSNSANKAIDEYIKLRGENEMTDEEAAKFAKENSIKVQNAVTKSYVLRTGLMVGSLVLAFITKCFNPIATLIPLVMYKPLLYAVQFIKMKRGE